MIGRFKRPSYTLAALEKHALPTTMSFLPCRLHKKRRFSALQHMELMLWQARVRILGLGRTSNTTCLAAAIVVPDLRFETRKACG